MPSIRACQLGDLMLPGCGIHLGVRNNNANYRVAQTSLVERLYRWCIDSDAKWQRNERANLVLPMRTLELGYPLASFY